MSLGVLELMAANGGFVASTGSRMNDRCAEREQGSSQASMLGYRSERLKAMGRRGVRFAAAERVHVRLDVRDRAAGAGAEVDDFPFMIAFVFVCFGA